MSRFPGSEGYYSPLRGAGPNLISFSYFPYPSPDFAHFLVATDISGSFTELNRISTRNVVAVPLMCFARNVVAAPLVCFALHA